MIFELNDEQKAIKKMVREFTEKEIVPVARDLDDKEEYPFEIIKKLDELGLSNLAVPEEYGGPGVDSLSATIIIEELAFGCAGVATSAACNSLALYPLILGGSQKLKEKYLPFICNNGKFASFCLTEPNAGSDVGAVSTTAEKKGNEYIINGNKCFITSGSHADYYTVFAKTNKNDPKSLSAFMVEADLPGVVRGKKEIKMGIRASDTAEIIFEEVKIPSENLIGKEGDGFRLSMQTLDMARPTVGAIAVGLAQAAFEAAVSHAKERVQFGRPIAYNQGIQFILADMATEIEAARLLVYQASWLKDQKKPFSRQSAISKLYASDMAMRVTTNAVQVLGGYGYSREYMVEKYMRDAKIMQIYEGTNEIHRIVIANQILK
ncbi:MAG: acyl-CoA dehydrogenase [Firmicutes bacterium]|nr:acyl-CoA dehydrogenase [Bacillota bacterium]